METSHRVRVGDARSLDLPDESVELVVTSPPYPMIKMWDDLFAELHPAVADHLDAGDGSAAFDAMHDALGEVWAEVARVLVPGGVACVNVGDAVRTVDDRFRVYPNHAEITSRLSGLGLDPLPDILWRKPTNSGTSFLGSARPTNAYVTLEHEYILVFRKGGPRSFGDDARRAESALFWEERNHWFSDLWDDVQGEGQTLPSGGLRERSAAFPLEIPRRLISMYSIYGDTVLDPFWGTGTTSLAAMVGGRSSVGHERDATFAGAFADQVGRAETISERLARDRFADHRRALEEFPDRNRYPSTHYDVPVTWRAARDIRLYVAVDVVETDGGYRVAHEPFDPGA